MVQVYHWPPWSPHELTCGQDTSWAVGAGPQLTTLHCPHMGKLTKKINKNNGFPFFLCFAVFSLSSGFIRLHQSQLMVYSCDLWTDHLLLIPSSPLMMPSRPRPQPQALPSLRIPRPNSGKISPPPARQTRAAQAGMVGGVSCTGRHGTGYTQVTGNNARPGPAISGSQTFVISVASRRSKTTAP